MSKPQQPRNRDPEHLERGDGRAVGAVTIDDVPLQSDNLHYDERVKELGKQMAAEPRTARPCEMMLSAPDEEPRSCGAPSVGGGKLYRYCKPHLEQVERAGGVVRRDGWA